MEVKFGPDESNIKSKITGLLLFYPEIGPFLLGPTTTRIPALQSTLR